MMTKNNKVMIPVILYRMLIATAVVGAGPPSLFVPVGELVSPGVVIVEFAVIRAEMGDVVTSWIVDNRRSESWLDVMEYIE